MVPKFYPATTIRILAAFALAAMLNVQCNAPIRLTSPIVVLTPTSAVSSVRLQATPTSLATRTPTATLTPAQSAAAASSPSASGTSAAAFTPSSGTINFSGYSWIVKAPSGKAEPGPNLWSTDSENVSVDGEGRLHLRVTKRNDAWYSAEVFTAQSFGYGVYRFYLDTDVSNYDPNVAAGLFTWSDDPGFNHRELDVEFSTWTNVGAKNAQYVVQPYTQAQNLHLYNYPSGINQTTQIITWQPSKIVFQSLRGHSASSSDSTSVLEQWTFPGAIPKPGGERVHINLWLVQGLVPKNGQSAELVVKKFEFTPASQN